MRLVKPPTISASNYGQFDTYNKVQSLSIIIKMTGKIENIYFISNTRFLIVKFLLIFIFVIATPIVLYSQKDSILTLKLQRTINSGVTKEKIINPYKNNITFITDKGIKYRLDENSIIGDTSIIIKNENISIDQIERVSVRKKKNIIKYLVGIFIINEGILATSYGLMTTIMPYKSDNNNQVYTNLAITGVGLLSVATGFSIIVLNRTYYTKNKWKIKTGYYRFNPNRYKLTNADPVDNYN